MRFKSLLLVVGFIPTLVMSEGAPVIELTRPHDPALDGISIENTLRPQYTNFITYNAEGIAGYVYPVPVIPGAPGADGDVVAKPAAAPIAFKAVPTPGKPAAAVADKAASPNYMPHDGPLSSK